MPTRQRKHRVFKVTLDVPPEARMPEVGFYILDAVSSWKGQESPDDPLFALDPKSIRVQWRDGDDRMYCGKDKEDAR